MRSLNAHLRQPEQHARLPFHPECPICRRERLVGSLPSDGLISRRAQAAIAAGVLALSAVAPVGTYAQEPDQTSDGTSAEEIGGGDPTHSPDFDPGGESTDLPFDAPPTPEVAAPPDPEDADAGPLEQEPTTDIDAPVADAGDEPRPPVPQPETQTPPPAASPSPAAPSPSQQPIATPTPTPTPAPEAPTSTAEPTPADTDDAAPAAKPRSKAKREKPEERPNTWRKTEAEPAAAPAAPTSEQTVPAVQAAPAPVLAVARGAGDEAQPGDRSHVVRPGESLWSIAADHLGGQATVAKIAREVNRLWELNRDRIGTGSPDLLMVGTSLTL